MSRPTIDRRVWPVLLLGLTAAVAASLWLGLGIGAGRVGWLDAGRAILGGADSWTRAIVLDVRLPRLLLAALVGAALSASGVAFQAVLRNPLADPYILGISGGSALGAVAFTALVGPASSFLSLGRPLAAFAGAMTTLAVLFGFARRSGRTQTTALLLVGVVLNAFDSAVILFLVTAGDASRFQGVLFYLVGSLAPLPWASLASVGILVAAGLAVLVFRSHDLNLLATGEETAVHLGVNAERATWAVVIASSLVTAAVVAFTGLVGFVGLMVPHAIRAAVGPDHRLLVPASVLGGASFVMLADTVARAALAPTEMPVGVITALVGGPVFLCLFLNRMRDR